MITLTLPKAFHYLMARTSGAERWIRKAGQEGRWRLEANKLVRKAITRGKSRDDREKMKSHCIKENI